MWMGINKADELFRVGDKVILVGFGDKIYKIVAIRKSSLYTLADLENIENNEYATDCDLNLLKHVPNYIKKTKLARIKKG